jgi:molybdopterin/thiamine biosynthesis adenylyltransferase
MNRLVFSRDRFEAALRALHREPTQALEWPAGCSLGGRDFEVLARPREASSEHTVALGFADRLPSEPPWFRFPRAAAFLALGWRAQPGRLAGWVRAPGGPGQRLDRLHLPGPGMITVDLTGGSIPSWSLPEQDAARWSRTIGALGEEEWNCLRELRCAVVGLGRTGSRVAAALARVGVSQLALIDPDRLDLHNLGEADVVNAGHLGASKAECLAGELARVNAGLQVRAVAQSITHLAAFEAIQESDVVWCCADHDSARLVATGLASLLCRPLIDLGTGVLRRQDGREMGGDVRLVLPGRCLLCLGGLSDETGARRVIASADEESRFHAGRDWRAERAGSLASLNQAAVAVALRAWEDLVAGRVRESLWAHLEFGERGRLSVSYPGEGGARRDCACPLSGLGASGMPRLRDFLRRAPAG